MAKIVETPLMKQYFDIKAKHPDAILLFRVGDFYEMYGEDAVTGAEILGIVQTKKANGPGQTIEMAGFPHHALDSYLPKLVRAGKRVAICDQLEDPKLTKKLVKRGITELVTPGVSINDNILNHKENNFLAAIHFGKDVCGIAFLDISTGEFLTAEGTVDYVDKLLNNFSPKEVLVERGSRKRFEEAFGPRFFIFELDDWVFTSEAANDRLLKHFETKNLKGFGVQHLKLGVVASGAILYYLDQTQHTHISHITSLSRIEEDRYVRLDKFTVRSLELVSTMNEEGTSLLDVLDKTVSPMGSRMLRRWILFPLKDVKPIHERQDVVEYFFRHPEVKELLEEKLEQIGDLDTSVYNVQCNSCDEFISDEEEYCPSCGDKLPSNVFQERSLTDLAVFCEEAILAMGINPVLARVGYESWVFHKGSSEIRMFVYQRSYLFCTSPINVLPKKNLEPVLTYLLNAEVKPYQLGLDGNQIYLSYRIHISDIFSDFADEVQKNITNMAFKADELDNYLMDTFGCELSEYAKNDA